MIIYEPIYRGLNGAQDTAVAIDTAGDHVCWFAKQQSVGLWYYKRLIFNIRDLVVSMENLQPGDEMPSDYEITVSVPENSVFYLYDQSVPAVDFIDNKKILKRSIVVPYTGTETYACVYIVGHTEEPGEYIEEVTIGDQSVKVGMEVYGENEALRINLQNMGVELPDNIVNSIYETDLYEEKTDWITLNNKWRELLINYMDIAGCKGNYKSLENSLKWFNYGRLVELRECWKQETPDGTKFMDRPLNRWLSDWYSKSLGGLAKSTYMVLRQCSVDLSKQIGTEVPDPAYPQNDAYSVPVYQPYTYDPERIAEDDLTDTEIKWAKDEMRMKMTLLGLFFETNFMPVHLDLLRASVEDIVFDTPYTVYMGGIAELESCDMSSLNEINIYSHSKDNEPDEDGFDVVIHLDQQSVYGTDNTFRNSKIKSNINFGIQGISDFTILGVTYNVPPTLDEGYTETAVLRNVGIQAMGWYNDIGAVADFDIITDSKIKTGTLTTNITGEIATRTSDIICEQTWYNVDWQGNILNYDEVDESARIWQPNTKYYKQVLCDQYAIVNQYGMPVDDNRFTEIPEGVELWTEDIEFDPDVTYYRQTSTATYVIVNGLGQQIDDTRYKEGDESHDWPFGDFSDWVEWRMDLKYKKSLYKTNIKLLCQHPGEFCASLKLVSDTTTYYRNVYIKVVDNVDVRLEFFKLVWDDVNRDPFDIENLGPNKNMFETTRDPSTNTKIYEEQGWDIFRAGTPAYNNYLYEIPAKVIDDYKYGQYLPLAKFNKVSEFNALQDKPRLSWVATISPPEAAIFNINDLSTPLDKSYMRKPVISYTYPNQDEQSELLSNTQTLPNDGLYKPDGGTLTVGQDVIVETSQLRLDNIIGGAPGTPEDDTTTTIWCRKYVPYEGTLIRKVKIMEKSSPDENDDDITPIYKYYACDSNGELIPIHSVDEGEVSGDAPNSNDLGVTTISNPKNLKEWKPDLKFKKRNSVGVYHAVNVWGEIIDQPTTNLEDWDSWHDLFFYRKIDGVYYTVDRRYGCIMYKSGNPTNGYLWAPNQVYYIQRDSMDDPTSMFDPNVLSKFYIKKGYEYDPINIPVDGAPHNGRYGYIYDDDNKTGKLTFMQITPKEREYSKTTLRALLTNIPQQLYDISIKQEYIPEYHKMVLIDPEEQTDIPVDYPIVAVPVIELNVNGKRRDLTWSHKLDAPAWKFYSFARLDYVDQLKFNIQQPFIVSQYSQYTPMGRYRIEFSYKWGNEVKTVSRMSPFNIIRS